MNICIFGASITWGVSDEKGGWVQRLRTFVESTEKDIHVYNLGVSGDNTEDLLKRFKKECEAREPSKIIISIGTNDSQYVLTKDKPRISIEDFESNLGVLVSQAKEFTKDIVFCGLLKVDESKTMPIPWDRKKFYDNENILKYNSVIKSVAEKYNLKFINLYDVVGLNDLHDGLHPTSMGHQKIFEVMKQEIDAWEPVIDFTKIKTGGINIKKIGKKI